MPKRISIFLTMIALFAGLILTACDTKLPIESQPITTIQATQPSDTPIPLTDTPIPAANKVWFVAGSSLAINQAQMILEAARSLVEQNGWQLELVQNYSSAELDSRAGELKAVIVLAPDPGLAEMAARHLDITFFPIGISGLPAAPNIYPIAPQGLHPEWEAYLAGYLAAVLTEDWRIGMITQTGTDDGSRAAAGFTDGGVMFCGLCNPEFPPYTDYPYVLSINAGVAQAEWQPIADDIIQKQIKTAYVSPAVATDELLGYLAQNNIRLITGTPPVADLEAAWIAVIQTDYASSLVSAWTDFIADQPPTSYQAQIKVIPVDTSLLSAGKMEWLNKVIADLTSGFLMP